MCIWDSRKTPMQAVLSTFICLHIVTGYVTFVSQFRESSYVQDFHSRTIDSTFNFSITWPFLQNFTPSSQWNSVFTVSSSILSPLLKCRGEIVLKKTLSRGCMEVCESSHWTMLWTVKFLATGILARFLSSLTFPFMQINQPVPIFLGTFLCSNDFLYW